MDKYAKTRFSTSLKNVTFLYYFLMRNILSLYLSFYDKKNRIWADFFFIFSGIYEKNAKKSPIFSRTGGSHDQNGLNFTFFEISIVWNYGKKEIRFIATLNHIL